jgi:hypothetical protein
MITTIIAILFIMPLLLRQETVVHRLEHEPAD